MSEQNITTLIQSINDIRTTWGSHNSVKFLGRDSGTFGSDPAGIIAMQKLNQVLEEAQKRGTELIVLVERLTLDVSNSIQSRKIAKQRNKFAKRVVGVNRKIDAFKSLQVKVKTASGKEKVSVLKLVEETVSHDAELLEQSRTEFAEHPEEMELLVKPMEELHRNMVLEQTRIVELISNLESTLKNLTAVLNSES